MIAAILAAALILNPAVTPQTTATTICHPGYAASIRPPNSFTARIKRRLIPPGGRMTDWTLDHWEPIELGGAPRDPRNLVLQPKAEARRKDRLENALHTAVCRGTVTLRDAQLRIGAWKP